MNNLTSLISDMKTVNRECGADANIVDVSTCNTQTFPSHPNSKLHPNGILKPSVQFNLARSSDDIDGITNDSNANSQRQIFHQSQGASVKDVAGDLHDECSKSSETSESFVSPQPMASHGFQTRSQAEAEAMPNVPLRRPHATFTYVNGEEFKVRDSLERPLPQFPDTKKHSGQKMSTDHRTAEKMHTSAKTPEFFTPPNISFQRPARTTFQGMPNWEPLHSDFSALREAVSEATAVSRKTLLRDVAKDVGNYSTYQYAAGATKGCIYLNVFIRMCLSECVYLNVSMNVFLKNVYGYVGTDTKQCRCMLSLVLHSPSTSYHTLHRSG
jgi:hypothetical protein